MTITKESKDLGMPREKEYGYSQAVKVGDTIYVPGQFSHDDKGNIISQGDMELAMYGATMENSYIIQGNIFLIRFLLVSPSCNLESITWLLSILLSSVFASTLIPISLGLVIIVL